MFLCLRKRNKICHDSIYLFHFSFYSSSLSRQLGISQPISYPLVNMDPHVPLFPNGLPDMTNMFSFSVWLGKLRNVFCEVCMVALAEFGYYPITGRCGHTICGSCHRKHESQYVIAYKPLFFQFVDDNTVKFVGDNITAMLLFTFCQVCR